MNLTKSFFGAIAGTALMAVSTVASAEIGGLLHGRSADLNTMPDSSVEVGTILGDYFGARYNYRLNSDWMLYGDLGSMDFGVSEGFSFGIGGYYMLDEIIQGVDNGIKLSYHNIDGELNGIAVEGIVSGRNGLGDNRNLQWYGSAGFNNLSGDNVSSTEFMFGFGVVHPLQAGEIFGGVEFLDGLTMGIGYRHFL